MTPAPIHAILNEFTTEPMKFSLDSKLFYIGANTKANQGDEQFGISIGKYYFGVYDNKPCAGKLNKHGALIINR